MSPVQAASTRATALIWRGGPGGVRARVAGGQIDRVWLIPARSPGESSLPGLSLGEQWTQSLRNGSDTLEVLSSQLAEYLAGERRQLEVAWKLDLPRGFESDVLSALQEVPYGETVTYGELAAMAGRRGAARAAGNALNRNPLPTLLPCHRVVRADGSLGGFGAGARWKKYLHGVEQRGSAR